MRDVQIAFQGGGARLADLLLAAEILQSEERSGRIRIRRVAGTSAGAIVAAIVACGGDSAGRVRMHLEVNGARLVRTVSGTASGEINIKSLPNITRMLRGKPFLNTNGLREALTEVLGIAFAAGREASARSKEDKRWRDLSLNFGDIAWMSEKKLLVVAADLVKQNVVVYPDAGDDLIGALVDSAALPFAFRGHRELVANPRVDGGLCQNLPSDLLFPGAQEFGEVLAVSFANQNSGRAPASLAEYIQALVATAINGAVARSVSRLDGNAVLPLMSSLSTFDFAKAFDGARHKDELKIENDTKNWIVKVSNNPPSPPPASATLEQAMLDIYSWYRARRNLEPRRSLKAVMIVTANCLKTNSVEHAEPDFVMTERQFAPQHAPTSMVYYFVGRRQPFTAPVIKIYRPDGQEVPFRLVPALERDEVERDPPGDRFGYVLLLDDPLPPLTDEEISAGQYYRLVGTRFEPGGLAGLIKSQRHDWVRFENTRLEMQESAAIVLQFPKNIRLRAHGELAIGNEKVLATELSGAELLPYTRDPQTRCMGWRVQDFPPDGIFRVDLYRVDPQ